MEQLHPLDRAQAELREGSRELQAALEELAGRAAVRQAAVQARQEVVRVLEVPAELDRVARERAAGLAAQHRPGRPAGMRC